MGDTTLTIFANSGRSGSTFLYHLMKNNLCKTHHVFHEFIPVQLSKPRSYNRAYGRDRIRLIEHDTELMRYVNEWDNILLSDHVVETGWTCYHLLPYFAHRYRQRLRVVILHREPWLVALSRANMGNYHPETWYDATHQVSPFDEFSIIENFGEIWNTMNPVERCLCWWYTVYLEALEFRERSPEIPLTIVSARDIFFGQGLAQIATFMSIPPLLKPTSNQTHAKNEIHRFMAETFPIFIHEAIRIQRHKKIFEFSKNKFGYNFDPDKFIKLAQKYALPYGILSQLRHRTKFWTRRRAIGKLLEKSMSLRF